MSVRGQLAATWRAHWPYVKLAAALFAIGGLLGVLAAGRVDLLAGLGLDRFDRVVPSEITVGLILVNNTIVFALALLGLFSLGLLTALVLVVNGVLVGYVAVPAARETGLAFVLVALLPHGVLELGAFFVAAAVVFRLLNRFLQRVENRRDRLLDPGDLRRIALTVLAAWLALAVAAVIEVHVTLWLLETLYPGVTAAGTVG